MGSMESARPARPAARRRRPAYQWARLGAQAGFVAATVFALVRMDFVLLLVFLGLALLTGAWFCGWLCPLGAAQEWIGRLGRRLFGRRLRLPRSVERFAAWFRYVLLGLSLAGIGWLALASQPYQTFTGLLGGHTAYVSVASWVLLGVFLALSLLVDRPFCRYFCVEGAQHGAVSVLRPFTIRRDPAACSGCRACDRACPVQITVSEKAHVRSPQCVNCLECMSACPRKGALRYGFFRASRGKDGNRDGKGKGVVA
jgi:ferredoxin-type protein NapH